jgi:hypothetical protein
MILKSIILSVCTLAAVPEPATTVHTAQFKAVTRPEIMVIKDLNANTKSYVYFSLASGKEVPAADAKTKNWDIAFSKTTIATNSGTSGPGEGGAIVLEKPFDQVSDAPKDGYKTDGDAGFAIPGGSGNSWYKYDMSVHAILPIPGRTLLVKTTNGKLAKVEIISYYKGAPEDVPTEESSYYTFRYTIADEDGKF